MRPVADESLRFQSDFFTSAEAGGFKKVSKKEKKKKRARDEDEEDRPIVVKIQPVAVAEEDEELYAQLSRLRRIERQKINLSNEELIAQRAQEARQTSSLTNSSSVSDFLARIDAARQNTVGEAPEPRDQEMESPPPHPVEPAGEDAKEPPLPTEEESGVSELKPEPVTQDIKVDSGLACALKFFHSRGEIEERSDEPRLEHRDDFGRVLDAKDAYKHMSRKFHGKKLSSDQYHKQAKKYKADIASKKIYN
jgi:U4/U6.U5 tri-snRNP-associated protein 1